MNVKVTTLLALSLTAAGFCAAAEVDPNFGAANPKFVSGDPEPWGVYAPGADARLRVYWGPGSIRPTYMAELYLPRDRRYGSGNGAEELNMLMKSPLAQKLSNAQKDFLAEGFGIGVDLEPDKHPNYYPIWFYAVSEDDAKTMALAFLDFLASEAKQLAAAEKSELNKVKERLQQNQAALPQKKEQLETAAARYSKVKNENYYLLSDEEAMQTAKEILLQMDKEARIAEVDLAGVRGKLKVIDKYIYDVQTSGKAIPEQLQTWKTEQMIELSGLEARQQAIEKICAIPRDFVMVSRMHENLASEVRRLTPEIEGDTRAIESETRHLEHPNPGSYLLPPKIYGDTVVIHPVTPQTPQPGR